MFCFKSGYYIIFLWLALFGTHNIKNMWKSEFVPLAALPTSTSVLIASDLTIISDRLCVLWMSTQDNSLRKSNFPCKHRYGLKFDIQHKKWHLVLLILLAGDIATNPGPTMATQSGHLPDIQSTREKVDGNFLTKCLVNCSLLSVHKTVSNHVTCLTFKISFILKKQILSG